MHSFNVPKTALYMIHVYFSLVVCGDIKGHSKDYYFIYTILKVFKKSLSEGYFNVLSYYFSLWEVVLFTSIQLLML